MSDPQDSAEATDADKIDDLGDGEVVPEVYPPEQPLGVGAWGTTANEERRPEPLGDFVQREEPDPLRDVLQEQAEDSP